MTSPAPPPPEAPPVAAPAPTGSRASRPRRSRLKVAATTLAGLLLVAALAGLVVHVPYVLVEPGDATPVRHVVRISGAPTYRDPGSLLFLTVSVRDRPNLWQWARAQALDRDAQVLSEHDYLEGRSRREDQQLDVALMDQSEVLAKKVALEAAGYPVTVRGRGVLVAAVVRHSPAAAHLRAGDVVTAVNERPVSVQGDLGTILRSQPVGATFTLTVLRGGQTREETLRTVAAPSGPIAGKPYIGVLPTTKDLRVDTPFPVRIDPGPVSGPSAGLAFTLTIIDELTPGSLTGRRKVAVTGTVGFDGDVGPVGGVAQKTATALHAHASLFIVPSGEARAARERAGSHIKVVGVSTVAQALRALHAAGGASVRPAGRPAT